PEVGEEVEEEEYRHRVIDAVEHDTRPRRKTFGHGSLDVWIRNAERARDYARPRRDVPWPALHRGDLGIPLLVPHALLAHVLGETGMDRHEIGRRFHAALLEAGHVLGNLREGRVRLGELGRVRLHDLQELVDVIRRHGFEADVEAVVEWHLHNLVDVDVAFEHGRADLD